MKHGKPHPNEHLEDQLRAYAQASQQALIIPPHEIQPDQAHDSFETDAQIYNPAVSEHIPEGAVHDPELFNIFQSPLNRKMARRNRLVQFIEKKFNARGAPLPLAFFRFCFICDINRNYLEARERALFKLFMTYDPQCFLYTPDDVFSFTSTRKYRAKLMQAYFTSCFIREAWRLYDADASD